jgi:hypothetical protein
MEALAFFDANILAKPFTRTILLAGSRAQDAQYRPRWSRRAEAEGQRALDRRFGSGAEPLASIRTKYGFELSATGTAPARFSRTQGSDRQILADAAQASATWLITEDVDDFDLADLASVGVQAIHYDLFAARYLSQTGYLAALEIMARDRSIVQIHAQVARRHPRLFARFADRFPGVEPARSTGGRPRFEIRG